MAALAVGLLLAACGGGGSSANQTDVQNDVKDTLAEDGYIAGPDAEPVELTEAQATDAGECVGAGLFSDDFTEDERDDVVDPGDGTPPDEDLANRFQALLDDCVAEVLAAGPAAPDSDED